MDERTGARIGPVIGVVGGSGGVGASAFAAVLAAVAGVAGRCVLVDLDPAGGGIDVPLGIESQPGARWSGLHLAGGYLDPELLAAGLPRAGPCSVLAADTTQLDPIAVAQVIGAAATLGPVVLDLPRATGVARTAGVAHCDLVVVLARSDVPGLVAAHMVRAGLDTPPAAAGLSGSAGGAVSAGVVSPGMAPASGIPAGVVVRRGEVRPDDAARLVGAPLLGVLPVLGRGAVTLDSSRVPRQVTRVAAGVLAGLLAPARGSDLVAS